MEIIKKANCDFVDGYITDHDKVVCIDPAIMDQLHNLDRCWQMYQYMDEQEPFNPGPTMAGFVYETWADTQRKWSFVAAPETPVTEARVKETMAYLHEQDEIELNYRINKAIQKYAKLLDFCTNDYLVSYPIARFGDDKIECSRIGNPLELKAEDVIEMIKAIVTADFVGQDIDD